MQRATSSSNITGLQCGKSSLEFGVEAGLNAGRYQSRVIDRSDHVIDLRQRQGAVAQQNRHVVCVQVRSGEVLLAITVEISHSHCERSQAYAEVDSRAKTARAIAQEDGHIGREHIWNGQVLLAVPVEIAHRYY